MQSEEAAKSNEIRVSTNGILNNYITQAAELLKKGNELVDIRGAKRAAEKVIRIVNLLRSKLAGLCVEWKV